MKCGMICLSHAAQLPVLNGRKRSPTFRESSTIAFPILVITKIFEISIPIFNCEEDTDQETLENDEERQEMKEDDNGDINKQQENNSIMIHSKLQLVILKIFVQ